MRILIFLKCRCGLNLRGSGIEQQQRRHSGGHLRSGFSGKEPLLARCCGAGRPQNQPRGNVVLFLGGSPQSSYRGPRVRVIAPEKEVMIGGVCRNPMEGFGGRSPKVLLLARKSRASTRSCIAVSSSARPRACLGREGGPEQPGSKQKAIIEAPFARRRNFGPATSTCSSDHMVLVSSCQGQHMTHLGRNLLRALTGARFTATSLLPRANEDPTAALQSTPYMQHSRHLRL